MGWLGPTPGTQAQRSHQNRNRLFCRGVEPRQELTFERAARSSRLLLLGVSPIICCSKDRLPYNHKTILFIYPLG